MPIFPYTMQSKFLNFANLIGNKWYHHGFNLYFITVIIEVVYLFICLRAIFIFFTVNFLFMSYSCFFVVDQQELFIHYKLAHICTIICLNCCSRGNGPGTVRSQMKGQLILPGGEYGKKYLSWIFFLFFNKFIYFILFIFCCVGSSSLSTVFLQLWRVGLLFVAVCRLLIVVASSCGAQALGIQASVVVARGLSSCGSRAVEHRLSSCGARAQLLRGMWDLPRPGLEPVSPALAGRFLTTAPPGKP